MRSSLLEENYPRGGFEEESRVVDPSYPKAVVATYVHEYHETYVPQWMKGVPEEGILNLLVFGKGEGIARNVASTMRLMEPYKDRVRVLTDWDVSKVRRGWLEADKAFFEENPKAGIIGHFPRADYEEKRFIRRDWCPGMFLVFRPGMEVDWRLEEADCSRKGPIDLWLCFRAWEEGWKVYENCGHQIVHAKERISGVVKNEYKNPLEGRSQQPVYIKFRARGWSFHNFPVPDSHEHWDGSDG